MKKSLPSPTASIEELAKFWDSHEWTDFEDQMEEIPGPILVRTVAIKVPSPTKTAGRGNADKDRLAEISED